MEKSRIMMVTVVLMGEMRVDGFQEKGGKTDD